jgi:hypothetical protein
VPHALLHALHKQTLLTSLQQPACFTNLAAQPLQQMALVLTMAYGRITLQAPAYGVMVAIIGSGCALPWRIVCVCSGRAC